LFPTLTAYREPCELKIMRIGERNTAAPLGRNGSIDVLVPIANLQST
jgi:hypothetical protein